MHRKSVGDFVQFAVQIRVDSTVGHIEFSRWRFSGPKSGLGKLAALYKTGTTAIRRIYGQLVESEGEG